MAGRKRKSKQKAKAWKAANCKTNPDASALNGSRHYKTDSPRRSVNNELAVSGRSLLSSSWLDVSGNDTESESLDGQQPFSFQLQTDDESENEASGKRMVESGGNTNDFSSDAPALLGNDSVSSSSEEAQTSFVRSGFSCSPYDHLLHRIPDFTSIGYDTITPPRRNLRKSAKVQKVEVTLNDELSISSDDVDRSVSDLNKHDEDQVKAFLEPTKGVIVLVMKVPSEITIYGKALIRALSGTVNVCGFDVSSENAKFYPLFSTKNIFSFQIKATKYHWHCSSLVDDLKKNLAEFCSREKCSNILEAWDFSSVIVVLKQMMVSPVTDFACMYYRNVLSPGPLFGEEEVMYKMRSFVLTYREDGVMREPRNYLSVADAVLKEIGQRKKNLESGVSQTGSRILVYGARGFGKSTLLRYLVNKALSVYPRVMFLDCDPGQTEFTPPACLSLTEVNSPLLGPPFTHLKTPEKMIFFGSVAIERSNLFIKCIRELQDYYEENFEGVPLFINTFGWLKSVGKVCLDAITSITNPTFVIKIEETKSEEELCRSPSPELTHLDKTFFTLSSARLANMSCESAASRRELSVLAYLGQCQPYYDAAKHLNAFIPYKVKASDIVIHCIDYDVDPPYRMAAVNASFVAMCCVADDNILVCKECSWPKKLKDPGNCGKCVGFAFVRAIDEVEGILYFVTPESSEVLANVNTFVKGSVNCPPVLFKDQGIHDKPLPYTRRMIKTKTHISKSISIKKERFNRKRKPL